MAGQVWAPRAQSISLVLGDGSELAMLPRGDGWYDPERGLRTGERYGFMVDGAGPFPDPRSLSLPDGVHGLSRVVDPAVFSRETGWPGTEVLGGVLYELHVGTFTSDGTLDAAISHLDHLVELGVDAVELMPLTEFPGSRGWGYDGVAPWSVHHAYGGQEALVRFVDAAHSRGLAVIVDVVHNHLGPEGNYLPRFGPYLTSQHDTPWGQGLNFDGLDSLEVREFFLGSARHLLVDIGVDGLRLDAVHAIADDSVMHFLAELALRTRAWEIEVGRRLTLIAESDLNQPTMVMPLGTATEASGMDAQWADDVHHALHAFFGRETGGYYVDFGSAETLRQALTKVFVHEGGYSTFRGANWGAPLDRASLHYDGHSFVAFLQDHDQVGNRAIGDRFAQHAGVPAQAAAAALYLLSPCTPMLFMGEEWAAGTPFPFFSDLGPELGPLVTEGRSREFRAMGWAQPTPDPQSKATFQTAKLDWAEPGSGVHAELLGWYQTLIGLRRRHPDLKDPDLRDVQVDVIDGDTLVLHRGRFQVVVTRAEECVVTIDRRVRQLASWDACSVSDSDIRLAGPGAVVLEGL
ncbi:maltooligosyltrehalose trehalohydrolase [Tessaracoccus bendigoensis DSM 12906]|uniref:Malto-oligosyltrehalose trehalohydrolase n=1 Tax=Tessaracoccus bendigoensis DSM 12906 TaxID=1123357 RepID=A0A1M6CQ95_9ACTN|nr:malto-oligosyltrehalose trehalohydrolase [Tessaracoccus bendigoensis]SHI63265.1 maltooligosyltrehalose trehalohydrolase [Tessaracoccus bendigoensis DSM 12906]